MISEGGIRRGNILISRTGYTGLVAMLKRGERLILIVRKQEDETSHKVDVTDPMTFERTVYGIDGDTIIRFQAEYRYFIPKWYAASTGRADTGSSIRRPTEDAAFATMYRGEGKSNDG